MSQQGAALQSYNNELVKCNEFIASFRNKIIFKFGPLKVGGVMKIFYAI